MERILFCNKFYENRWIGFVDMVMCIFVNVLLWLPSFWLSCHVTKIEKYYFTGFGLCFALENSSS